MLVINNTIIQNLQTQKARSDKLMDKYKNLVIEQAELPSNVFMEWTKYINPFLDAIISSKLTDHQLIERYEKFIKELIEFEQQQLVLESQVVKYRRNFDFLLSKILNVEKKYSDLNKNASENILRLRVEMIAVYQQLPEKDRKVEPETCIFCGKEAGEEEDGTDYQCEDCIHVPDEYKETYAKKSFDKFSGALQKVDEEEKILEDDGEDEISEAENAEIPEELEDDDLDPELAFDESEDEDLQNVKKFNARGKKHKG